MGGEGHSGWLPDNAAVPQATQEQKLILNLEIVQTSEGGYRLEWWAENSEYSGDTWHENVEDAKRQALYFFKVNENVWQEPQQTNGKR